ncbi:magnesium/cobalt transporter CorA [Stieleria varia]|uniref:Magnesium transport protein CorA n=1 Tax=Stieleria varia TaxID=2528005 RepID=A0A5C6ALQ2_9BACT|nr:magnesium/cobalt transporter CorA [Stieleria varia]TWU00963.1 Magnesium transport protein CorA [Stieleria varia]
MNRKKFRKLLRRRSRTETKPGTAPGTLVVDHSATQSTIHVTRFNATEISRDADVAIDSIPDIVDGYVLWVDVVGLGDFNVVRAVAKHFNIHDLSLEDVVKTHQRPKIEVFDDHLYIVVRMPHCEGGLDLEQVSLFVGKGYVVTWQERPGDCFQAVHERLQSPIRAVRQNGSDFLAYALVDAIIDEYFPLVHQYGDTLEEIEDDLVDTNLLDQTIHQIFAVRSDIRTLRRVAWSHREMIRNWMAYNGELTSEATQLHLRDVADHTIRVVELLEGCRETCADLRDLHMSATSMRMNEVMKVLTVIATIFIPLGFIAGVYGMNFSTESSRWNMPETQWKFGYPMSLALMSTVAIGMLIFFRRKGWIGGSNQPTDT